MGKDDNVIIKCPLCNGAWEEDDDYESHLPCPAGQEIEFDEIDYLLEGKKLGKDPKAWKKWLRDHPEIVVTIGLAGLRILLYLLSIPLPLVDEIVKSAKKRS